MKKATGVVVKVDNKYVCVRTLKGEFINVKLKNYTPNIGDIYTSTVYNGNSVMLRRVLFITFIITTILLGQNIYSYFKPSATVIVSIPPTIQLKINKWDKIIEVKGINSSGKKLSNSIKIKNKSLNVGLEEIISTAKTEKFIDAKHLKYKNPVTLYISCKENKVVNLIEFDNFMKHQELTYQVNNNGMGTLKN
ncbi:anti-sigma factor domain-containing protein [Clostridium ganghwense]|uniref:Anti-sigma factor domain-containing protein n=1 Tax=Clostridium ganghwense TaxID=312089 RepID=A0ABT4CMC6_9CLOT|nr:anti-sigma factor domain-containing protein [Clostridium ganghwense]MCY6370202.1 anti-sigma factor domain-containing protein [Clostridium ganghwense]